MTKIKKEDAGNGSIIKKLLIEFIALKLCTAT